MGRNAMYFEQAVSGRKIAVVGDTAFDKPLATGGGSTEVEPSYVVTPLEAMRERVNKDTSFDYYNTSQIDSAVRRFCLAALWEMDSFL